MIKVLFFGRFREQLDCPSLDLPWEPGSADLEGLEQALISRGGELWGEVLSQDNVIRSVNQEVVSGNPSLQDGDEVAFFPPVTGG